jgi:hypothetical protein
VEDENATPGASMPPVPPAQPDWDYQVAALTALARDWWQPPAELIGTLPGRGGGPALSYLGHADTTRALIEADPYWTWIPMATDDAGLPVLDRDEQGRPVGMWIWIQVCGVERPAYGSCEPGKRDAVKELIGDAIRNGAMRFGVAGGLWSKADRGDVAAAKPQRRKAAKPSRSNTDMPVADPAPVPGTAELKALHLAAGPDVSMAQVAAVLKAEGITDRAALTDPATFERAKGLVATAFPAENTQNAGKS